MSELKELLVEQLQDLLNAENQIVGALPKMADAAHHSKLKMAFEKHLMQTEKQVERLKTSLQLLGESLDSKPCKGMQGILAEGEEAITEGAHLEELTADLGLIGAAQKVEHYEISAYGSARCLAKQLGERKVAKLLAHSLGEEEAADFLLTDMAQPLLQQALSVEVGNGTKTPWGEPGSSDTSEPFIAGTNARSLDPEKSHSKTRKAKA